ncbi:MAG: TRAP transporter small permease subunit, partial [Burkholderiales bacterium]|nr:TRAP transporter small permease subunit [Burkholderiales bacterium]
LFIACTLVIAFDVLSRKFGFQMPGMGSTRLQELEWHIHTALFSFWLGAAYIKNAHVRIDIAFIKAKPRTHVWAEFLGCVILAIPYCLFAIYFSLDFTWIAWIDMEASPSSNGLPYRWIPKAFISAGLIMLFAGVISVLMRTIVYLWGPETLRNQAKVAVIKDHHGVTA